MKESLSLWRKSVFIKLMFFFICIIVLLYMISVIIYNGTLTALQEEMSASMQTQVSYYADKLEDEIERIRELRYELMMDSDVKKLTLFYSHMNSYEARQSIIEVQRRLNDFVNVSEYIQDAYCMFPEMERKISSVTYRKLDVAEYEYYGSLSIDSPDIQERNGTLFMSVSYRKSSNKQSMPDMVLVVELSRSAIEDTLRAMLTEEHDGVLCYNKDLSIVINTGGTEKADEMMLYKARSQTNDINEIAVHINSGDATYLAVFAKCGELGFTICKYTLENVFFHILEKFQKGFLLITAVAIGLIVFYTIYLKGLIKKPLDTLGAAFLQVENGDFNVSIRHDNADEFKNIFHRFNAMVVKLNNLIDQVYRQKILMQKAELKQLQSQINPHFLYNSFFILNTMSRIGDYENLEKFTLQLGDYFRFITRSAADEIAMRREVEHARTYTDIQSMRFSNRIRVEFDELPEPYENLIVPRLILQPVIENSFEHGLEQKASDGILRIRFQALENGLNTIVEDNGEDASASMIKSLSASLTEDNMHKEITGIININQRLKLKFGEKSGVFVERSELGGVKVILHIEQ